jgi:plastocyanin
MTKITRRTAVAGLAAAPLAAAIPSAALAATHQISIEGFKFNPAELSVAVGDTVVFTNNDGAPHTGTADDKSWSTARLNNGQSGEVVIATAGDHPFFCQVHPNMKGLIKAS